MALPLGGQFDVILGDEWLRHTQAVLSYAATTCTLHHPSKGLLMLVPVPTRPGLSRPLPLLSVPASRAFQVDVVDSGMSPWAGFVSPASSGGE